MPPRQAGRGLPRAGATCTWQLAMWGSVPRQLTRWIQKEFFWAKLFSLEDRETAGGGGVEGSSGLRKARHWGAGRGGRPFLPHPSATLPQGYTPHLNLGSLIFESQTFLEERKQWGVEWVQKSYPSSRLLPVVPESAPETSQFENSPTGPVSALSFTAALRGDHLTDIHDLHSTGKESRAQHALLTCQSQRGVSVALGAPRGRQLPARPFPMPIGGAPLGSTLKKGTQGRGPLGTGGG